MWVSSKVWLIVITLVSYLYRQGDCYRILFAMPYASGSHKNMAIPIIVALAERGHQVTFISGKRTQQLVNVVNVREIVVNMTVEFSIANRGADGKSFFENIVERPFRTKLEFLNQFRQVPENTIISTLSDTQIKGMLESDQFDLVMVSMMTSYIGYPFAWHFNCPLILVCPNIVIPDIAYVMGDSEHADYIPFMLSGFTDRMNLWERTVNTALVHFSTKVPRYFFAPRFDKLIQSYLPGCPPILDIERNLSLVLTNSHPTFTYPRASPPRLIEVGALQCRPAQPLPKDLQDFIDPAGDDGFLVFAVGSVIQMNEMPAKILQIFERVFSRLPHRVIWQWKDPPKKDLPNVLLSNWLPQQDLLGHPKCKAFITHGGLFSTQEAVYHGVPLIGIPFVADQESNMIRAVNDGYAVKLDWAAIDEAKLNDAIQSVLHDPKYRSNVERLQALLRDQPETPLERAVFWTEYVLRNRGASVLELASKDLSRLQRNSIDVYAVLFLIMLGIVKIVAAIIRYLYLSARAQ